jgi:DNA polymerase III subunit gamma/tau
MSQPFHLKYRPRKLDQVIGHEKIVDRLKGIISSKKYPNAILFTGPTSAGKTTLARCFAAEVNETDNIDNHPDYLELNAGASGKIDDIRGVIDVAKLMPQRGKRRFLTIDEAHNLTGAAAQALLKPLENPPERTIFILCSMEPEKFSTGTGRAIANRCSQFVLQPHSKENIVRHLKRIVKKEEMSYADEKVLAKISDNSNGEMRTAASLLEALQQYAASEGSKKITDEDIDSVISSTSTKDDEIAIRILLGVYAKKFSVVQRSLLDAQDSFGIINKMIWLNSFMLNNYVLRGEKHPKVWWNKHNQVLNEQTKKLVEKQILDPKKELHTYALTQMYLVRLRQQASSFLVPEQNLVGSLLYECINGLRVEK